MRVGLLERKILAAQARMKRAAKIAQEEAERIEKEQSYLRTAEVALLQPYQNEADKHLGNVCNKLDK